MKFKPQALALSLALMSLLTDFAHAAVSDAKPETPAASLPGEPSAAVPQTSAAPSGVVSSIAPSTSATQHLADRCTDFTTNGWAFKAPRNFLKWLDIFSDPGIYLEFANRSLEPQSYVRTLSSMLDPGTVRNYLEWTNPEIYNGWAQSAAQPEFYNAVGNILFDSGRIMRWAMLPFDGRLWNVAGNAVNPNTWVKWLYAPVDPKTQELLAKAANPETTRLWLEALTDPKNTPWFNSVPPSRAGAEPAPSIEPPQLAEPAQPTQLPSRLESHKAGQIRL